MGSLFLWALMAGLLAQNLVIVPVMSRAIEDQKNYYSPEPHAGTPPSGGSTPSHGTPSHGSGGSYGGTPPSHETPSHGSGGSYGGTPPSHGTSPSDGGRCSPTPSTPSHGGGGSHHHTPTPSVPSGGGGTYYPPSPPYTGVSPPYTGGSPPVTISPPTTPIDPGTPSTPGISVPSPPFFPFPGTCDYWRNHPAVIWGLLGWFGTLGGTFGSTSTFPGFSPSLSLQQALSNTRSDGYGALYREGTASLLNSMVNHRFPYTTPQVRDNFVAALGSNKAAATQAHVFRMANEGRA